MILSKHYKNKKEEKDKINTEYEKIKSAWPLKSEECKFMLAQLSLLIRSNC